MPFDRRQRVLVFLFASAGLLVVLLAAGLSSVPFDSERAFAPKAPLENIPFSGRSLNYNYLLFFYIFLLGASLLAIYLHREGRRRSIIFLAVAALIGLFLYRFVDQLVYAPPVEPTPILPGQGTAIPTEVLPTVPPLVVEGDLPVETPGWLVTAIGAVLAFLLAAVLGLVYLMFGKRQPHPTLRDALALEAAQAAAALQGGEEIRDVVLRCYNEMERILAAERNLPRGSAVTPREFELTLVRLGFPSGPVRTLTNLFEAVRYGHAQSTPAQTQQAVESLQNIAAHVQGLGEG